MNRIKLKRRLVHSVFIALEVIYVLTGLVFISTRNAGGVSLGLLFLGAAALLFLGLRFLDELQQIRTCLVRNMVMKSFLSNSPTGHPSEAVTAADVKLKKPQVKPRVTNEGG